MTLTRERVDESVKQVKELVRKMGDGQFEPVHYAGDPEIVSQMQIIAASESMGTTVGFMFAMLALEMMTGRIKELKDEKNGMSKLLTEHSDIPAMVFLAGYRLGLKDGFSR